MIKVEKRSGYEYRVEVITMLPKAASEICNRIASEGWRLINILQTSVPESLVTPEPRMIPALYCVYERKISDHQDPTQAKSGSTTKPIIGGFAVFD